MLRLDLLIALEALEDFGFQLLRLEVEGVDDVVGALVLVAAGRPAALVVGLDLLFGEGDRLHHLAEHPVRKDHRGHAVAVGEVERVKHHVDHLLDGGGGEDEHMQVAVAGGAGGLPVVGLGGLDAAEPRASALDVDDQAGQVGARQVGDPLRFEGDARGGGGGHGAHARGGRAVDHVDRGDLRLRLHICTADLGHLFGHIRRDFRLRGDGVAEEMVAARLDRRFRERLIPLH